MKEIKKVHKFEKYCILELDNEEIIQVERINNNYYIEVSKNNSILYSEEIAKSEVKISILWILSVRF